MFYIQSNSALSFPTGNRTLAVLDISVLDKAESLSFAQADYSAIGEYELYYQYQHEYQEAYQETYTYTTSYTETYTEAYDTWVDDPVDTTTTTSTAPAETTPVVTTTATNSGATNNSSSDDSNYTWYYYNKTDKSGKTYNYATYGKDNTETKEYQKNTNNATTNKDEVHSDAAENSKCVIATYANSIGSEVLNSREKKKAEIWCIRPFHDKWWGEAIRRGYRYLGNKAIAKGTAEKHFQEFIDYVNFGSGKQRTVKSGLNFVYRTFQFITYGLTVARREK